MISDTISNCPKYAISVSEREMREWKKKIEKVMAKFPPNLEEINLSQKPDKQQEWWIQNKPFLGTS